MTGFLAWLGTQAHAVASVLSAVLADRPAPARQVVIYMAALALLLFLVPKILKLASK